LLDVRDTEYIWCRGTIKMKIETPNRDPLIIVHYEGWNRYYDEVLPINSNRIAPAGLYSAREDIPRYQLKTENSMQGQIINRISSISQ
jgi:hypothetical protein